MTEPIFAEGYCLMLVREAATPPVTYSLEAAARLAGVHPAVLQHYCRLGLFGAARSGPETELIFDDDALYELRRFEHYRRRHGVNRKTLRLICELWREIERLETELRFLRRA